MSLAIVHSRAQSGVSAPPVTVEVHLSGGLPGTSIVGLPETAVKEARDRVRVAIQNAQLEYPSRRVTVSLAPADLPKDGGQGLVCLWTNTRAGLRGMDAFLLSHHRLFRENPADEVKECFQEVHGVEAARDCCASGQGSGVAR